MSASTLELRGVSYHYVQGLWRGLRFRSHVRGTSEVKGVSELTFTLGRARALRSGVPSPASSMIPSVIPPYREGEGIIYGVTGANGAGKSTLFKLLCGDLYPQSGALYLGGVEITNTPRWKRARLGLGYLSQRGSLINDMSVELNLTLGVESGSLWGAPPSRYETSYAATTVRDRIAEALKDLGVAYTLSQKVKTLSGGERRRVELARLALSRPRVLLLDEPFAALDAAGIEQTLLFLRQTRARGALIVLTDHQSAYVEELCDQLLRLDSGRVIESDST